VLVVCGWWPAAAGTASAGAEAASGRGRAQARAAAASSLHVTELEWRMRLSVTTVKAGPIDLLQLDSGREPHDLRLRREGGTAVIDGRLLVPGRHWQGVVRLDPGTYRLWCSLPQHAARGMRATLRVVR
jgi:hypothetical protein